MISVRVAAKGVHLPLLRLLKNDSGGIDMFLCVSRATEVVSACLSTICDVILIKVPSILDDHGAFQIMLEVSWCQPSLFPVQLGHCMMITA